MAAVLFSSATPWTATASAQSLPSGWRVTDIGRTAAAGSATWVAPTLTVISQGSGVTGTTDQFTFVHAPNEGNVTIVARLKTVIGLEPWAQAGLMIREATGAGAQHVSIFGTPLNGVVMRHRQNRRGDTTETSGGTGAAPVWLRLERRGSRFTASRSANGTAWTTIRTVNVSMSAKVRVGFAIASNSKALGLAATFDSVSIDGQAWTIGNLAPTVSLTSPTTGSTYGTPASIALAATAADADGAIAKVEFYSGSTLLATDTTRPYSFSWAVAAVGSYDVRAVATDDKGASTASATATVSVIGNSPPVVSLSSPADKSSFVAPVTITFAATASDSDGRIERVEFYLGTTLVATDTTSPYSTTWPAVVGTHSLSAVATDDKGARTVSAWRDFIVTAAGVLGTAVFKPASPDDEVDYYLFEVFPAGANPESAAPIATQNIGRPAIVGGECHADVRDTVVRLAAGSYIATVSSMSPEGKLRSNTFAFTR